MNQNCFISKKCSVFLLCFVAVSLQAVMAQNIEEVLKARKDIANIQSKLRQSNDRSNQGAKLLVQLVDLADEYGRPFTLIQAAKRFVVSNPEHERHPDIMLRLIDAQLVVARHKDAISTARQFISRHADHAEVAMVHRLLADIFRREGKMAAAAQEQIQAFESKNGHLVDAARAIRYYRKDNSHRSHGAAANLAIRFLSEDADLDTKKEAVRLAMDSARRSSDNELIINIGQKINDSSIVFEQDQEVELHRMLAGSYWAQKKTSEAEQHLFKLATASQLFEDVKLYFQRAHSLNRSASEMQNIFEKYKNHAFSESQKALIIGYQAYANARDKNYEKAAILFLEAAKLDVEIHQSPRAYVRYAALAKIDLRSIEQELKSIILNNSGNSFYAHYALAFDLYRDRMKEVGKAQESVRVLIQGSLKPNKESIAAMNWLLASAPSDAIFNEDANLIYQSILKHAQFDSCRNFFKDWQKNNRNNKKFRSRVQVVTSLVKKLSGVPVIKLWNNVASSGTKSVKAREALLSEKLQDDARDELLSSLAYDYRHRLKERKKSVEYYSRLAKRKPKDYGVARSWVEAAYYYGNNAQKSEAVRFTLGLTQSGDDHSIWYWMLDTCVKLDNPVLGKEVFEWIKKTQSNIGLMQNRANEMGKRLAGLGLLNEAKSYWDQAAFLNLGTVEASACVNSLLEQSLNTAASEVLLKRCMGQVTENYLWYVIRLADLKFSSKDWDGFEATLLMGRQLVDEHIFISPEVGSDANNIVRSWIRKIVSNTDLNNEKKQLLLSVIESIDVGLGSAVARLSLGEVNAPENLVSSLQAQKKVWEAVMWSQDQQSHWDSFMPFAENFSKNKQHANASALLTAMLNNISRVDEGRKKVARDMVSRLFAITSEFEMDLDDANPLAPLLRIGMLAQIGDRSAAVDQYIKLRKLFDEKVKELPTNILLFGANIEIETANEIGLSRAEEMLRLWLVHNSESKQSTPEDQVAVQLLLAKTYFESGRYDIARSEYTTALNKFPDSPAATDARFGIAQCYVEQKVFDKAEEIFTELRDSKLQEVNLRSEFMMGVMAVRQGDFDFAREMFQSVLERMPENELANETLYHLAEVYGIEQRFLDQLNMLRTIGRLGQRSKRWHMPGNSLFIIVHDSDLGISRGNAQIPVNVTTDPGGDTERVMLLSGSAGKGLFTAEMATILAEPTVDDGVLQVTGADAIYVDYPEEFKREFKDQLPQIEVIRIASDAVFDAASRRIKDQKKETVTEQLARESEDAEQDLRKSVQRNESQIRPGNLVYLRVEDLDRDTGREKDKLKINLSASNGDKVTAELMETEPHSGVFAGEVPTGEMPAGATASDSAINHNPLLSIDHSVESFWMSEPNGDQGKWLMIDMKDVYPVDIAEFMFGGEEENFPTSIRLLGSHDGRFEYEVARFPFDQKHRSLVFGNGKTIIQKQEEWKYHDLGQDLGQLWRGVEFNDNNWNMGKGPLGYGDLGSLKPTTLIKYGEDSSKKYPTAYFRKSFIYDSDSLGVASALTAHVLSDDGFVLYLNGVEVVRNNLPDGEVSYNTLTLGNRNSNEEDKYIEFPVSIAALRDGVNVLAAEVHQPNGTSTDLGFDLEFAVFSDKSPVGVKQRVFQLKKGETISNWDDAVRVAQKEQAAITSEVAVLEWAPELLELKPKQKSKSSNLIVWSGQFVQRRPGAVRFKVNADVGGVLVGGRLVASVGKGNNELGVSDIYLEAGLHSFMAIAWMQDIDSGISVQRARENLAKEGVDLSSFRLSDFVLSEGERDDFLVSTANKAKRETKIGLSEQKLTAELKGWQLRNIKIVVDEYSGNFVSIKNINITSEGETVIPPREDVLEMARNNILEISAGDSISAIYIDQLTEGGLEQNRQLEQILKATYFNGAIRPISYEFRREAGGSVQTVEHELLRVEPGERIVVEVTDFDLDQTSEADKVSVLVQVNLGEMLDLEATETGPNTGVFRVELATTGKQGNDTKGNTTPEEPIVELKSGDKVYMRYLDGQNTIPGHKHPRESVVFVNEPSDAQVRVLSTRLIPADLTKLDSKMKYEYIQLPFSNTNTVPVTVDMPFTFEVVDPDRAKTSGSRIEVELDVGGNRKTRVECVLSAQFAGQVPDEYGEPITAGQALVEGRFVGQVTMNLGDDESPYLIPLSPGISGSLKGEILLPEAEEGESDSELYVLNLMGGEIASVTYLDELRSNGGVAKKKSTGTLVSDGALRITDSKYEKQVDSLHVGERIFLVVDDKDQDLTEEQDQIVITVKTTSGENESLMLTETLTHSGLFTGSFPLIARSEPRSNSGDNGVECFFGDELTVIYRDQDSSGGAVIDRKSQVAIAIGTDGLLAAFSKVFEDVDLAAQTRFHIAESYFELFKSQKKLERQEQALENLAYGRRVLLELAEDFPEEKYVARVSYLLGQFSQEQEDWQEAIKSYRIIIRRFPDHALAPDAQYKMAQCYEEAGDFDQALEEYVAMAAIHPDNPLIPKVMIRINEYYYLKENFLVAARVSGKFIERFPEHELASRMAFRWGQCHYKQQSYDDAAERFENFAKRYPDDPLCAEALFWAGESHRMDKDVPMAFRYYNRCRWDYPESEAAKFARGRLALPEMLAQFEREADLEEE